MLGEKLKSPEAYVLLGELSFANQDFKKAIRYYQCALLSYTDNMRCSIKLKDMYIHGFILHLIDALEKDNQIAHALFLKQCQPLVKYEEIFDTLIRLKASGNWLDTDDLKFLFDFHVIEKAVSLCNRSDIRHQLVIIFLCRFSN
jgi:hypothetical protein